MRSLLECKNVINGQVVRRKPEMSDALAKRLAIEEPIYRLIVKSKTIGGVQLTREARVVSEHHLNGSNCE